MIIIAKFTSVCPCCNQRIDAGSKVEWTKGSKAAHVACAATAPATATAVPARRTGGVRTGCSCGSREYPDGTISDSACKQCKFDHYDN